MALVKNLKCTLTSKPGADNPPCKDNFAVEECDLPADVNDGEVTIQTLYLSLDPAMRCRMNDDTGVDYVNPWKLGETVLGFAGIGKITRSKVEGFKEGDVVQSGMNWPWTTVFNSRVDSPVFPLRKVEESLMGHPQTALSLFGLTGLTAYLGVVEKAGINEGANQTFVVSGAAGATGNLAGQVGKLLGASKVIGICGSTNKCSVLTEQLGFDAAINYKTENVEERLREVCPEGIHTYFDNVGGEMSEIVIKQMVANSHVVLCGQIAVYNKDMPYPPPISEELQNILKSRTITRERFLVLNYESKFGNALTQLQTWYQQGKVKNPVFVHEGLPSAPLAFVNMMTSVSQDQVGKQMVHVS